MVLVVTLMETVFTKQNTETSMLNALTTAVIQAVSVFAVGFADHFVALSGGDQSITNSNSNFGSVH